MRQRSSNGVGAGCWACPRGAVWAASIARNGYRRTGDVLRRERLGWVLHTINPRLHFEQVAWIVNHAEDEVLRSTSALRPVQAVHPARAHGQAVGGAVRCRTAARR